MAVESVLLNVPNANVVIYVVGRLSQTRHFQELSQLQRVAVCHLNPSDLFKLLPKNLGHVANVYRDLPSSSVAAQSNILRYCILFLYGGVYLDFDTFTLRPIHEMKKNSDKVKNEYYLAPSYNYLLKSGGRIHTKHMGEIENDVFGLGTPEDLDSFLKNPHLTKYFDLVKMRLNIEREFN